MLLGEQKASMASQDTVGSAVTPMSLGRCAFVQLLAAKCRELSYGIGNFLTGPRIWKS